MVEHFDKDEEGYLAWVHANPQGYVVNVDRECRFPQYPMVHRSTHRLISSPTRTNYTSNEFIKHCSIDLAELENFAKNRYRRSLNPCATCMESLAPADAEVNTMSGPGLEEIRGAVKQRPIAQTQRALRCLEILLHRRDQRGLIAPITGAEMLHALDENPRAGVALGQARSLLQLACVRAGTPLIDQLIVLGSEGGWTGAWEPWLKYQRLLQCAPRLTIWRDSQFAAIRRALALIELGADAAWKAAEPESMQLLDKAVDSAQSEVERFVREAVNGV